MVTEKVVWNLLSLLVLTQDLNLEELQQANDHVKAFGVVLWLEASCAKHILSADSLDPDFGEDSGETCLWFPFPGKAFLDTFCDCLREQRLERQRLQVHLGTAEPSDPEVNGFP